MIVGIVGIARPREICVYAFLSLHLLGSVSLRGAACSVKTDIITSLILHANIAKITAHELSLSCFILCII